MVDGHFVKVLLRNSSEEVVHSSVRTLFQVRVHLVVVILR